MWLDSMILPSQCRCIDNELMIMVYLSPSRRRGGCWCVVGLVRGQRMNEGVSCEKEEVCVLRFEERTSYHYFAGEMVCIIRSASTYRLVLLPVRDDEYLARHHSPDDHRRSSGKLQMAADICSSSGGIDIIEIHMCIFPLHAAIIKHFID